MEQIRETAFDWTSRGEHGYFTSNEKNVIRKMLNYVATRPGEVTIIKAPETNGGYLLARVPKSWMKIKPPSKRELTDEQRATIGEKLAKGRKNALRGGFSRHVANS